MVGVQPLHLCLYACIQITNVVRVGFDSQGSCVAMVGKGCVAIACDLRLGNQALTVACNFEKVRCMPLPLAAV